ncbi:MAG TPA: CoA-acylating methylmalonate-semialdehyde dehydrogenase [Solirubrobacteraceae bacterium]|jgi:malonate-semialdehyde dehydrogenase (acetylating)/methylmalonate-semialdehyde dehydrogenase
MTATGLRTLANRIGGEWRAASGGETLLSRNPATGEPLANVPLSTAADVDAAVRAARAALPGWRATSPVVRARAVMDLRTRLVAHRDELARIVTADMGKTLEDASGEVGRGIESVESATAVPHLLKGENLEGVATKVDVELVRHPVGVVAAITPFNFPAMIPLWFLPFAVACGNTLVLKPSERDPLASERIVELCEDVFPPGVVNLLHGGREAVDGLLDHPDVDAVSFVGSATVARHVYARAAAHGKRVQALGGAKNAMVVMPDAAPDVMAAGVTASAFGAAGQRCLAGSVAVLVGDEAEQDRARDRIVEAAAAMRVGPGDDPSTDVGPLVDASARERVEAEIDRAEADGVPILLDGRRGGGEAGAELGPTVVEPADPEGPLGREELFGPLLTLVRAPTLDAAVEWINAGRYGNAAVIFTTSGAAARAFRADVEAGMLGVNVGVAAPVAWFPFSGWKDSMAGDLHANGRDAVEFYTRKKVVTARW